MNSLNIHNLIQTVILRIKSYYFIVVFILILSSINVKAQQINQLEYFWNTDPGIGMATPIIVIPDSIIDVTFQPSIAGLPQGINSLYVRAKNDSLHWSFAQKSLIFITLPTTFGASEMEYFIDTDPGFGQGTYVAISNDSLINISFNVNLTGIQTGLHTLYVRTKNQQGFWSFTQKHNFFVTNTNGINNIVKMEYFIDSDPGIGLAIDVPIEANDSIDIVFNPTLTNVSQGVHTLYIRTQMDNGMWSHAQSHVFFTTANTATNIEISELEYYFDQDPGPGNGNPITITQNDTIEITAPISLSGLTVGVHKLYIRGKDVNNHWSHIHRNDVNVTTSDMLYPIIAFSPTGVELTAPNCVTNDTSGFYIINTGENLLSVNLTESLPWLTLNPTLGGIQSGDSLWITAVATPSSSLLAQNIGTVTITNNSVDMPSATYTLVFNVPVGTYTIEVSHDSLDMGSVQVNDTLSGTITLLNTSCSTFDIDTIIHSNPLFSHEPLMSSPPTSLPGYTFLGVYDGHSYYKSNGTSTWLAAESSVNALMGQQGLTGYMVTINSSAENQFLLPFLQENEIWIGVRDADGAGTVFPCESVTSGNPQLYCWKWGDGTSIQSNNYSNWNPGEPNNSSEDFCMIYGSGVGAAHGKWNDWAGGNSIKHILEIEGGFPPNGTQNVTINFESPIIGSYQDTMIIVSPAGNDTVYLTAEVVGIPLYSIDTDTIELSFMGCSVDSTITTLVHNNGDGPLAYNIGNTFSLPSSITINNPTDTIAVGDSTAIGFTFTNFNKPNGTYNYKIEILTNDTLQPKDTLYLQVTVMGEALLTTTSSFIHFDTILRNTQTTEEFYIKNEGCEALYVSDISANNATIFGDNTSSIYLPPYSHHRVVVNFAPPLTGDYQDTISITTADSLYKVPLFGVASGALTFELSSYASNVDIDNCMGMTMDTIKLYNVGDGNGTFNITNAASFPTWLQASPLSGSIAQGDSINLVLSYDAMALTSNIYTKTINIATSDPLTPNVSLSTSMYVIGAPVADVNKDTLDFHTTYFTTERFDTINISNMGCDTFEILSIGIAAPFSSNVNSLNVLPNGNASIIIKYDPNAIAVHDQIMYLYGETDTLEVLLKGDAVQYPIITSLTKDTLTIQMPYALDASTVNAANLVVWGEQSGRRTGAYIVDGSNIYFVPTQNFFAGEKVTYTLTKNVKYTNGEFVQPYSDRRNVKVWHVTNGDFVIRPTNLVLGLNAVGASTEIRNADMDGDNKMDMIVKYYPFNGANSTIKVLKQNSTNNYTDFNTTTATTFSVLNSTPDLNNDGKPDVYIGHNTPSQLGILLNNGNGALIAPSYLGVTLHNNSIFSDFDLDGDFDLTSLSGTNAISSNFVNSYKNNGLASFTSGQSINTSVFGYGFLSGDFDHDGWPDLNVSSNTSYGSQQRLRRYKNNKGLFVLQTDIANTNNQFYTHASHFGNDLEYDFLLNSSTGIQLINNNGSTATSNTILPYSGTAFTYAGSSMGFAYQYALGDLDGDQDQDILVYNSYNGTNWHTKPYRLLKNNGDASFVSQEKAFVLSQTNPSPLFFSQKPADLDSDGDLDFAFLDAQGKLWIAYNEDSNADLVFSQDTIQATYTTCSIDTTYNIDMTNIGDSTLVWQINLPTTIPTWISIDTSYGQILKDSTYTFPIHINTAGLLAGTYSYNLIINHNDTSSYRDTIHIGFTLQNDSIVLASDTVLHFGLVDINVNKTLPITISNPGCAPINLTASISPTSIFTYSGAPIVVPAFGSKVIQVTANTITSGETSTATLQLTHNYGNFSIPLTATACYVSPITHIYEQVCTSDSVGLDSIMLMNVSGCDSLVVIHYELPNTVSNIGLVAHYPFNGNANDVSGNNKHGSVNGATLSVDRFGNNNNAYSFDGTNDEIVTTYQQSINGQFTVSAWVKTNMAQQTNATEFTVIQNRGPVNQGGKSLTLGYFKHENAWRFGFDTDNQYFGQKIVMSNNNQWMHIVGVMNTNSSSQLNQSHFKIYINGVLVNTTPNNGSTSLPFIGLNTLKIGRHDAWNSWFQGQIDDVQIYQRALSSSEIETLYNSHLSTLNIYNQTCHPDSVTIDTTILAGANQYGCDSTIITQTSLYNPISNEGLVAYYTFDGNAQDMSGYNNDGVVNGATLTTDRFGMVNKAYSFDGNDWIRHTDSIASNVSSSNFTVSTWIKRTQAAINTNTLQPIFGKQENSGNYRGYLLRFLQDDRLEFITNYAQWYGNGSVISTTNITDTEWHHIVAVLNGQEGKIKIYKDGSIIGSASGSNQYDLNTLTHLYIGKQGNVNEYFIGNISDFHLYNRALSDTEIQALYNANTTYTQTCIPADIGIDTLTLTNACGLDSTVQQVTSLQTPVSSDQQKAYYPFSSNANDMSGFGNNGTVNGATLTADRFGNANGAYSFNGVNDYINIPNPPRNYGKEITVSWWVNVNSFQIGSGIGQSTPNVSSSGTWLMHGNVDRSLLWYVNDNGTWRNTPNTTPIGSGWHHIVGTAKSDSLRLYIDGNLAVKSVGISSNILNDINSVIHIGKDVRYSSNRWLNGSIDDVQVFTRALSLTEIQAIYNNASQYTFNYTEACDPTSVGLDTLVYTGGSNNGCDSLSINLTSLSHAVHGSDLVAYYAYNGNAQDMSGYGLNALVNGAIRVDDRYGRDTSAYQFDGVDDYLSTEHNALLNPSTTPYTISMHFKSGQSGQGELLMKTSVSTQEYISISQNAGNINVQLQKLTQSQNCNTTGLGLNDNAWHHLLFTRSPSATKDTQRIYIDGILVTMTIQNAILDIQPQEKLYTGIRKNWNGGSFAMPFSGVIDDITIYKQRLTTTEIIDLAFEHKDADIDVVTKNETLDFGVVVLGNTITNTTFITNTTCDTIALSSGVVNAAYTASLSRTTLLPYQSAKLTVNFTANAVGNYNDTLMVYGGMDSVAITLLGQTISAAEISLSDSIASDTFYMCNKIAQDSFYIYNTGQDPLNFSITSTSSAFTVTPTMGAVAEGDSIAIHFTLNNSNKANGNYTDSFIILSDDNTDPIKYFVYQYAIDGPATFGLMPDNLDFGQVGTGMSNTLPFTIFNTSCDTIFINAITYTNAAIEVHFTGNTILPYSNKMVNVTYSPFTQGSDVGYLYVNTNGGLDTVNVSGSSCLMSPTQHFYVNVCAANQVQADTMAFTNQYGCDSLIVTNYLLPTSPHEAWTTFHLPFSGNGNDATGHGYNATLTNATYGPDRFNAANKAISFDGFFDYAILSNTSMIHADSSDFAVSLWMKSLSQAAQGILSKANNGNANYFNLELVNGDVKYTLSNPTNTHIAQTTGAGIADSDWHHLIFSKRNTNGQNIANVYIDNTLVKADTFAAPSSMSLVDNIYIGMIKSHFNGTLDKSFHGSMDNVRWLSHHPSSEEINRLYLEGIPHTTTEQVVETVCDIDSVGLDTMSYVNQFGCDSLVVVNKQLPSGLTNQIIAGYTYLGQYNNHSYYKSNGTSTWLQAKANVSTLMNQLGMTGYLASINNAGENAWLLTNVSDPVIFMGMTDGNGTGTNPPCEAYTSGNPQLYCWRWEDGTNLIGNNYQNWALSEPNDASGIHDYTNFYGNTFGNVPYRGKWNDLGNTTPYPHILEISGINQAPTLMASQDCSPTNIGIDTTILANANQYGCDSTIITTTSLQSPISPEGLVAYYTFDGNANDMSGLGNNGVVNGATLTADRFGNANGAYSFDGVNDYVGNLNIPLHGNGDWTIASWIKFNNYNNNFQSIISNFENSFQIGVANSQSQLTIYDGVNGGSLISVNNGVRVNKNDFFVFQKEGNTLKIFRNDTLLIQNSNGASITFNSLKRIGTWNPNSSDPNQKQHLNAKIEDILIFQRALNSLERKQLYYLNKSPNATIVAKDTLLNFGTITKLDTATLVTYVSNATCDTVVIDTLVNSNERFLITNSSGFILLPYESKAIEVKFIPDSTIVYMDELLIFSSDTVTSELYGVGCIPRPMLVYTDTTALCSGQNITVTTDINQNITWNNGTVGDGVTLSNPGIYYGIFSNGNGCVLFTDSINIISGPDAIIQANGVTTLCVGDSVQLVALNSSSNTWSTSATTASIWVSPDTTTTYYLNATNSLNCNYLDSIVINVIPPIAPDSVQNMVPFNNATGLANSVLLSWLPANNASTYDLFLWIEGNAKPSTPTASNLNQIAYQVNELQSGITYRWQIYSKNSCFITQSVQQTFTTQLLPDLIVQNVVLPPSAYSGTNISVSWQVKNTGPGTTMIPTWTDRVYLSEDNFFHGGGVDPQVAAVFNVSGLSPNQSYTSSASFNLPQGISGDYYVFIISDAINQVPETNNNNNFNNFGAYIDVFLTPPPDLKVINSLQPNNTFSGQSVNVDFTVKNDGTGSTLISGWTDRIYFSSDNIRNGNDLLVKSINHNGILQAGQSYNVNTDITIPSNISGTYFIIYETDIANQVYEFVYENNNIRVSTPLNVLLTPPADLTPTDFEISKDTLFANEPFQLSWTAMNQGAAQTQTSAWHDKVYVSDSLNFSITNSTLIFNEYHVGHLNIDSSYLQVLTKNTPNNINGLKYFHLLIDGDNQQFEVFENNNTISFGPVLIMVPDLSIDSIWHNDSIIAGQSINISYRLRNNLNKVLNRQISNRIFLSQDATLSSGDLIAGTESSLITLLQNETIDKQITYTIPQGTLDTFNVFVHCDYNNQIFENGIEGNNIAVSSSTLRTVLPNYPDLKVTNIMGPDTINAGTAGLITINVINEGLGDVASGQFWSDRVYMSSDQTISSNDIFISKQSVLNNLASGGLYSNNFTLNIPPSILGGYYYLIAKTDVNNQVYEYINENNNEFIFDSIWIEPYPKSNLTILEIDTISPNLLAGQSYNLQAIIKNIGSNNVVGMPYKDGLYLSSDTILSNNDMLLSQKLRTSGLSVDSLYTQDFNFMLPINLSGTFYFIVKTDTEQKTNDESFINNTILVPISSSSNGGNSNNTVVIVIPPTPDLKITSIITPSSIVEGQPFELVYIVQNIGDTAIINKTWIDRFYLSTSINPTGLQIGSVSKTLTLGVNQTYTDTVIVQSPIGTIGNRYVVALTDAQNNVFENQNENNNSSPSIITIYGAQPADAFVDQINVVQDSAFNGQNVTVSWVTHNLGQNPISGQMTEAIYFSTDSIWDANDLLAKTVTKTNSIIPNGFKNSSTTFELDNAMFGKNHVFVRTDIKNNILEDNENNNISIGDSIFVDVKNLPLNTLTMDVLKVNKNLYYRVNIADSLAEESLIITTVGDTINGYNESYVNYTTLPTRYLYQYSHSEPFKGEQEVVVPDLVEGNYFNLSYGTTNANQNQNVKLLAEIQPFEIKKVVSNIGSNTGEVTVRISGARFEDGMTASLTRDSLGIELQALKIVYVDPTTVYATFDLSAGSYVEHLRRVGLDTGFYDLKLLKENGDFAILENGFKVVSILENEIEVNIINPPTRTFRVAPITIQYQNVSGRDLPVPKFLVVSLENVPIGKTEADLRNAFGWPWGQSLPVGYREVLIELIDPRNPESNILPSGSGGIHTIYFWSPQGGQYDMKIIDLK